MARNLSLGAILTIVVVVALIVSVATASITGNVIVKKSPSGTANVYYKTEINNLLKNYYKKTEVNDKFRSLSLVSGTELNLNSNENPTQNVKLDNDVYKIELVSATDTSATIKITNVDLPIISETQEIGEGDFASIIGFGIYLSASDETNTELSATIIILDEVSLLFSGGNETEAIIEIKLTSDSPTEDISVDGEVVYTLELVSASDTAATIKVTNEKGTSVTKEINEGSSAVINGVDVKVVTADETSLKLSATLEVN